MNKQNLMSVIQILQSWKHNTILKANVKILCMLYSEWNNIPFWLNGSCGLLLYPTVSPDAEVFPELRALISERSSSVSGFSETT